MKMRSLGILAAATFALAISNTSYGHAVIKENGSSHGKGSAHGDGGIYTNGSPQATGSTYGASNAYANGGSHDGGNKSASGSSHAKGGAYGNGSNGSSSYANGGAYSGGSHAGGGSYANGVASNGGAYGNGDTHSNGASYGGDNGDHDGNSHDSHTKGSGHFAILLGGSEVSDEGKANVGEPKGRGTATVTVDPHAGKLCYAVIVDGIDTPVAAHVHQAPAGQNGPIVVSLNAPSSGDPGTVSGCVDNIDSKLLRSIHAKPWSFYVNVHTGLYPNGAVRGQLF